MALSVALKRVERAMNARTRAEKQLGEIRAELNAAIVAAHAAGESYSAIGRVLGVSRQRVAEIVEQAE